MRAQSDQPGPRRSPTLIHTNPAAPEHVAPPQLRAFLHELGNLIDGSVRSVSLAQRDLERAAGSPGALDDADRHLAAAGMALSHIVALMHALSSGAGTASSSRALLSPLAQAIGSAVNLLLPLAQQRSIELTANIEGGDASTHLSPIFPAILNALRNSIEAIEYDGTIHINASLNDGTQRVIVHVFDSGPGPAVSDDPVRLFELGASTKPGSRGFGLALARQIVGSIGGSITLEPRWPDQPDRRGAVLTISYPLPDSPLQAQTPE